MFSEKTKNLAAQLRQIEEELNKNLKSDLKAAGLVGELCISPREQIWFERDTNDNEAIKAALPTQYVMQHGNCEHVYFKVGDVPFVTVLVNNEGEKDNDT